jgi:ABC-type lipoprotein release transport system permease subunit
VAGGRIEYVRLFSIVAIFILLIACINFMNLATARSMRRAKEVGVRKVVGAARFALMVQFMGEALLLTLFSIIIAVIIVMLLLPAFNSLIGKQLTIPFGKPVFWMALTGLLLLTGFVAGSYPALFLSSLKPIRVLKGRLRFNVGTVLFRKGLVILQFSLSILFVIGMIVTYRQLKYIQTKNIGYDRENLVYVPLEGDLRHKYGLFKEEALKMPGILQVSKIRQSPTGIASHTGDIQWPGKDPNVVISFANTVVGYDFVKTMNLQLGQGRDFSKNFGTDTSGYIINEAALQRIGYKDPIGKPLTWGHHPGTIIGVLRDFHFASMHQAIDPLIIRLEEDRPWATMLIRTQAGKTKEAIAGLEKISKVLNPKFPFTYQFSDQEFDKLYRSEGVVSKLSNYFAFLAIFISCLGLFGLATFTAEQRTKEIGIRKAIGASTPGIYRLLLTNLLKPVVIAMLISFPVAWYTMNRWLEDFVYRVNIGWQVFILAGSSAILIALMTVSFQAIKAAITNPVKSLRTE